MSFSPAQSNPDSMSISSKSGSSSPTGAPDVHSTKWPPSPEHSATPSEIVAEAKAKISRWSGQYAEEDVVKRTVPAPQKTKFVPKVSPKMDPRQAALNKLAARRLALTKKNAAINRDSIRLPTVTTEFTKLKDAKGANGSTSSSIQISLRNLPSCAGSDNAPVGNLTTSAVLTSTSTSLSATAPPHSSAEKRTEVCKKPASQQLIQAMQATLLETESRLTELANTASGPGMSV